MFLAPCLCLIGYYSVNLNTWIEGQKLNIVLELNNSIKKDHKAGSGQTMDLICECEALCGHID